LADGNIEFLGRLDQQVKLRGQRIELGEVEEVLARHPLIRECAVVARDETAGETELSDNPKSKIPNPKLGKQLVAYLVSNTEKPSAAELRAFLKKSLPEYMIPASFVRLDELPLGPNGKLDRQSLAGSIGVPLPDSRQLREPRTRREKTVAAVWRELLQLDEVGVDDDFFAVGGHSLLAVTLVSRLGAVVDREISLGEFLAAPTIGALAAKLADGRSGASADALPPIAPLPLSGELPLSMAQEQFFKLDELVSGAPFLHLPYAYRLDGPLNIAALRRSLRTIVERHAVLRTVFRESRGRLVQIVRAGRRVACPLCVLSHLSEERQKARLARLSKQDAERPFDLANGPPVRFTLLRLAEQRHVLFVTMHHIIADQSSLRLFRAEMAKLYHAFARTRAAPLADLPFQFADYTRWQAAQLKSGKLDGQIDYWRHALAGAAPTLMFRRGKQRPRMVSPRVVRRTLAIDDGLFAKVRALARRLKTTAFVILVAALDVWLYRLTDCRDLRIGTLVANRNRRGAEKLIGYFVNAVVLRRRVEPRLSFAELIEQIRRTAQEAFAHQDVPIEVVARALQQKNSRQRAALYQVLVNYRRFEFKTQKAAGLTIASYSDGERAEAPEIAFTSADLTFDFRELSTKLTVSVNFRVDLFDPAALDSLLAAYAAVVEQAVAEPERRLGDWPHPSTKLRAIGVQRTQNII
jgi:hypothetical protein